MIVKYMTQIFTRIVASFGLPVTFGSSGLQLSQGMAATCPSFTPALTQWIVNTLGRCVVHD